MHNIKPEEARSFINRIGDHLGCDFTAQPVFPEGRKDICAVKHTTENGSTYGYDTVYLVWDDESGKFQHREVRNTKATKDYLNINGLIIKDGKVFVDFGTGGLVSGTGWYDTAQIALSSIGEPNAKIEHKVSYTGKVFDQFPEDLRPAIVGVLESHRHQHPLYKATKVMEGIYDPDRQIGSFILFEQIDTDRLSEESEGWLGDQFRYSVWELKVGQKPTQLLEDHAYIRPRTKSELTGTRGRDCSFKNLRFERDQIVVTNSEGQDIKF